MTMILIDVEPEAIDELLLRDAVAETEAIERERAREAMENEIDPFIGPAETITGI